MSRAGTKAEDRTQATNRRRWRLWNVEAELSAVGLPPHADAKAAVTASPMWALAFEEFSASTGRLVRTLHEVEGEVFNSLEWTNSSGSVLVVAAPAKTGGKTVLGVLSGRRFVAIPGAPQPTLQQRALILVF